VTYDSRGLASSRRLVSLAANVRVRMALGRLSEGLLHVHSPFVYGAMRPMLSLGAPKRVVHIHLDYTDDQMRWCLSSPPDLVVTCGRFIERRVRALLDDMGARRTAVVALVNAVDVDAFTPDDKRGAKVSCGIDPDRPLILLAANLSPHKGQETALRALRLLVDRGHSPLLWLAGEQRDGGRDYLDRLSALSAGLGLQRHCTFLGFRDDMPLLIRAADYLVLPSTQEGLPLSILEAQASGTVVLAAPTAGIPEVIDDGRTGFLIAASDASAYADRIARLMANPGGRADIAAAALTQVRSRFTFARYGEQIIEQYDRLLPARR
jgi:glycosyltransferase involved in cell wall biosynthesis